MIVLKNIQAPEPDGHLTVLETHVSKAIISFPAGSAGGPDGLSPQHLKDLINCREAGSDLITALTAFVNMCLSGSCPRDISNIFFGGKLISLNKKSGGIRPIVIGFTLRRLTSKLANTFGISRLATYFSPRQLLVGTPGGCEAAVHASRRFLHSLNDEKVFVKLDFSNAFNSLHRQDMLLAIRERLPEIYAYVFSSYAEPSNLFYGSFELLSSEGPQQGDPLGPLLFSNAIQPLLNSLKSELTVGYLDDLTLAGTEADVENDVKRVIDCGCNLGLKLNISKCELITNGGSHISSSVIGAFQRVSMDEATLLGAPLFQGRALDESWKERCEDLSRAAERLSLVSAQEALILLRSSFGAPRVQHMLRCSPSADHPALTQFDEIQLESLNRITNSNLTETQFCQATLPIKDGGLGLRKVATLALPAFLSSSSSTQSLQDVILSGRQPLDDACSQRCLDSWASVYGTLPIYPASAKQTSWDRPGIERSKSFIEASCLDLRQKAIFLASKTRHSGDWLSALPIAACGLRLDDEAVRVAVANRLGLNTCVPHDCRCGATVDAWGSHAMVCKKAQGRITRHQAVNDIVARAFTYAGVPISKEPTGLLRNDGKRPDGLTLVPWQNGKALAWDVTVATTLADSYLMISSDLAGAAAEKAATKKTEKYSNLPSSVNFQPIAMETLGVYNATAVDCLNDFGRRISATSGEPRESKFLLQRISVALQRYNAILLHQSFATQDDRDF